MATQSQLLTLGELEVGSNFIVFPTDGDDSGHGGFRRAKVLFTKLLATDGDNVRAITSQTESRLPDDTKVIRVV